MTVVNLAGRLRARRVDEAVLAARAVETARETGRPAILATHGGGVALSYGWHPAMTEGALAVGFPDGRVVVWLTRISAYSPTKSRVAATVGRHYEGGGEKFAAAFDKRFAAAAKAAAEAAIIRVAEKVLSATD